MSKIETGTYGGVRIELDKDTGILKMAEKQGVLMRVRLINRLFGSIMEIPFFSMLLRKAGIAMGEDYVLGWLLENKKGELPTELRAKGQEFQNLQEMVEQDSMDTSQLTEMRRERTHNQAQTLDRLTAEVTSLVLQWLQTLPSTKIRSLWQEMHDEDVFAGWGRAELVAFDREQGTAQIQMTASFIARLSYYWYQQGHANERICSFFEGYFVGEAHIMFGRDDLNCFEQSCRLQGANKCTFVIEPESLLISRNA